MNAMIPSSRWASIAGAPVETIPEKLSIICMLFAASRRDVRARSGRFAGDRGICRPFP